MTPTRSSHLLAVLAVLVAVLSLAVGTSFAKQLFPVIGAQGTIALRVGFSAVLLLALWRPWRWPLSRLDAATILRYGIALGFMNLLFYMAIRTIPFGIAVAIEFAGPLGVALWSSRRPVDFFWAGLAVVGLLMLLPLHEGASGLDPLGVLYAMGAAVCWGAYIIFGKRVGHLHSGHIVSLGLTVAAVIVVPIGVVHAGSALLDWRVLMLGVVVAVVSSSVPISLEMVALKRLRRETYGILASIEPALVAMIAVVLLDEHLHPMQWLAIACTVLATAGSTLTAQRGPTQSGALH